MRKRINLKGALTVANWTGFGDDAPDAKTCEITIRDDLSGVDFISIRISPRELMMALFKHSCQICEFELRSPEVCGLKREMKDLVFEIPKCTYATRDKVAYQAAVKAAGEGWEASSYFGSQGSFFTKDGKNYARTHAVRYVKLEQENPDA